MVKPHLFRLHDDDGHPIAATYSIEWLDECPTIVCNSRGGTKGAANETNREYTDGVDVLLKRLANISVIISDATVDSKRTQEMSLSHEDRRLRLRRYSFPIVLTDTEDLIDLRKDLCAGQRPVGREEGAKGMGNNTKRMRMFLDPSTVDLDLGELEDYLSGPVSSAPLSDWECDQEADSQKESGGFDPDNIKDARQKTLAAIVRRQGQPKFRNDLLKAYSHRCAISDCDLEDALEAAHILAYKGKDTNKVENGILLRSDLHTLFDRGLITIDTESWTVIMSDAAARSVYGSLHGSPVNLPAKQKHWPSKLALDQHRLGTGL